MRWFVSLCFLAGLYTIAVKLFVFADSLTVKNASIWDETLAKKSSPLVHLIEDLKDGKPAAWIADNSPVLWWHPSEKYKAVDPLEVLQHSELWYREVNPVFPFWTVDEVKFDRFDIGKNTNISYHSQTPTQVVTRIYERGGLKEGAAGFELHYDVDQKLTQPAVMFWRLSLTPLFKDIQPAEPSKLLIPIEFWYYSTNNVTGVFFGNHKGDWESFLILFEAQEKDGVLDVRPRYVYTSAHFGGTWHCPENLSYNNDKRLQLYSAVGTHATYISEGIHWAGIFPDRTGNGEGWNTWQNMRAVVKEPYYGFSGNWGHSFLSHAMSGPIIPGPMFKYIPAGTEEKVKEKWTQFAGTCKDDAK